jgi:outer membrane protein assembly factor BamB
MKRVIAAVALGAGWIAVFGGLAVKARAQTEVYFRHDAHAAADDQSLPDELDDAHLAWKQDLPPGHSTPSIVGNRILLTGNDDGELATICLDRSSGKVIWKQGLRVEQLEKIHAEGSHAAASVACNGKRVFSFFGSFGLLCYDLDGAPLWTKKLGPFRDEFGAASSPILVDGNVILNEDHDLESFLIAVRQDTGETVWQTPREGFTRSYATPVVWEANGKRQIVVAGSLQLVAYNPADGQPLWSLDGFARIVNTTPASFNNTLYVCTWSPGGDTDARIAMEPWARALALWDKNKNDKLENAELPLGEVRSRFFRIDLNGDQILDKPEWNKYARIFELAQNTLVALRAGEAGSPPRVAWEYKRGLPYVPSPLVYRGNVYLVKDGGIMTVLDAAEGKLIKQGRSSGDGNYYASPVGGDSKVFVASGPGVVTVFRAGGRAEIVSSRNFKERVAATPIIADGRIYVRTEKALYCFAQP